MYVLVETEGAKTHNFATLDDLNRWVKEQNGDDISGTDTTLHSTLEKVKAYIDTLLTTKKKEENKISFFENTRRLPPPAIKEFKMDDTITEQFFGEITELREVFPVDNSNIKKFEESPEELTAIHTLFNFFVKTFCVSDVKLGKFNNCIIENAIHLALLDFDFCVKNKYMVENEIIIPEEIYKIYTQLKKYAPVEFVKIAHYCASKAGCYYLKLNSDCFLLYQSIIEHGASSEIAFKIICNLQNGSVKGILDDMVIYFLQTLERNENSSMQSTEVFTIWKKYLENIFKENKDKELYKQLMEGVTQKHLAKELKKNNILAQRKSAGIFYLGVGKGTTEVSGYEPEVGAPVWKEDGYITNVIKAEILKEKEKDIKENHTGWYVK